MKQETLDQLSIQLGQLGFDKPSAWLDKALDDSFTLLQTGYPVSLVIPVTAYSNDHFQIERYEVTIREFDIPEQYRELDEKLHKANELYNAYYAGEEQQGDQEYIQAVNLELEKLLETDRPVAELFILKYMAESEYKNYLSDPAILLQRHEKSYDVPVTISAEAVFSLHTHFKDASHWLAYNKEAAVLQKDDLYFASSKAAAIEFAAASSTEHFNIAFAGNVQTAIQIISNKNQLTMNENNLKYLQDNIKYHGFGEMLNPLLEEQIKKGIAEFTLPYKVDVNKRDMEAMLHFKKSDTTDMYFFNKYEAKVKNEKDQDMAQTFYINKGTGVTLKEAYNLLNGRAVYKELVNKEDQKYKSWIQLDFSAKDKHGNYERKPYHDNYGYDLKEALSYFPIKEMMKEDTMKDLLRSLEKGNIQMVALAMPDKEVKVFIEACPKYKNINVYDNRMKPLQHEHKEQLMQQPALNSEQGKDQSQHKDVKQETKQKQKPDDDLDGPKKKSRKKGMSM